VPLTDRGKGCGGVFLLVLSLGKVIAPILPISILRVKESEGNRREKRVSQKSEMQCSGCITLRIISNVKILVKT
jgi:hypothetical protein